MHTKIMLSITGVVAHEELLEGVEMEDVEVEVGDRLVEECIQGEGVEVVVVVK